MKKNFLTVLSLLVLLSMTSLCYAKGVSNKDIMNGIKLYKAENYTGCYEYMLAIVEKDPSNALAYYYIAMSASQAGRVEEAIDNYNKVLTLVSENGNLGRYAKKGKVCLEKPDACSSVSLNPLSGDGFITSKGGSLFSEEVKMQLENFKREELRRDINRDEMIDKKRFNEFKDFSTMNNTDKTPSNDEIVAALRTLQRAGLGNMVNNNYSDLSMLTGVTQQSPMMNMLGGNSNLSPQVIQALLTNNMSQGF